MTKATLSALVLAVALLLIIALAATRCNRGVTTSGPVTVIVDTVAVDTASHVRKKPAENKRKKKAAKKKKDKQARRPTSRPYLQQYVDKPVQDEKSE